MRLGKMEGISKSVALNAIPLSSLVKKEVTEKVGKNTDPPAAVGHNPATALPALWTESAESEDMALSVPKRAGSTAIDTGSTYNSDGKSEDVTDSSEAAHKKRKCTRVVPNSTAEHKCGECDARFP